VHLTNVCEDRSVSFTDVETQHLPRILLQHGLPTGSQPPLGAFTCSGVESSMICRGTSLPLHGLHHGLLGNLCSGIWSTYSSSSFFTDLGVCTVVSFTYSSSSIPLKLCSNFFYFLNMLSERHYHHR